MKVRNGFVSNSSSSSFIIAFKDNAKPCPTCGKIDSNIAAIRIVASSDDEGGFKDLTLEQVVRQLEEEMCWSTDAKENKEFQKEEKKVTKMSQDGYQFAEVSFSIHNTSIEQLIDSAKNIKRITDSY